MSGAISVFRDGLVVRVLGRMLRAEREAWKTPSRHPNAGPGRLWSLARGSTASERSGASIRPSTVRPGGGEMFRNLLVFVLASVGAGEVLVSEETGVLVVVTMLSTAPSAGAGLIVDSIGLLFSGWSGVGSVTLGSRVLSTELDGSMAITASVVCWWVVSSPFDPWFSGFSWLVGVWAWL